MSTLESDYRERSAAPAVVHEHGWEVESRHRTSAGHVLYVRCAGCGTRRIDLQEHVGSPPTTLSVEVPPR